MRSHKRPLLGSDSHDRDITLQPPKAACLACYDTGVVSNSDGMIRQYLADYDLLPDGTPTGAVDCAVICYCAASYGEQDHQGKLVRGGYRSDSGEIRPVETESGQRFSGVELPKSAIQEIHNRRKAAWNETCRELNRARQARSSGEDPQALPWFLQELSSYLRGMRDRQAQREQDGIASRGRRAEALGDLLQSLDPTAPIRVQLPEQINGPVGFRPAWHPDQRQQGDGLSPVGRAQQDQQDGTEAHTDAA